jgi:phosphoribosylformylglycinamidine cyclo-ligase
MPATISSMMLAQHLNQHDTIGIDLVAMCVNDVLVQGAEPLFFLDYFACGRLDVEVASDVIAGIAEGCHQAGAALIGGETAEMPDMYPDGEYDLAGFCVGAVERNEMIDGQSVSAGDVLLGIASSGPHSNGYSLIRKVLDIAGDAQIDGRPAREVLLEPTRIYVKSVLALMQQVTVKGLSHITGGGISENLPRILPDGLHATVDTSTWQQGAAFDWLAENGNIDIAEMRRTFNCGVGMIVVADAADADTALTTLQELGEDAWRIGQIEEGAGAVEYI